MDNLIIAAYAVLGILMIFLLIKILIKPIKWIFKLLLNAALGFVFLFIFNYLGAFIGVSLTVGWASAIVVGILGIPGIILLLLIENFFI